jgi:hypothetical protein
MKQAIAPAKAPGGTAVSATSTSALITPIAGVALSMSRAATPAAPRAAAPAAASSSGDATVERPTRLASKRPRETNGNAPGAAPALSPRPASHKKSRVGPIKLSTEDS